jgi:type I protein arginine methyltransferase
MYTIANYGAMIADTVRTGAFVRALRGAVKPGSVVIDIGTGTGIFALLACQFGARRVYAIEPDDAIQVAREIVKANGDSDRVEFIQAMSTDVSLPERADVIISDIGGILPWYRTHIPTIADARRRFLAPGGALIPQQDTAWAGVVDAPYLYAERTGPWEDNPYGFDMEAARRIVVNTWTRGAVTPDQLLVEPRRWATLDYSVAEDPDVRARVSWTVTRAGTGHGLVTGFDRIVGAGEHLSNAPDADAAIRPLDIYGTVFFPWSAPVPLSAGDLVTVDLEARFIGQDYVWNWKTAILDQGITGADKAVFTQSTLFGSPLSPARLRKRAASHSPSLTENGRIARLALDLMSKGLALGEIAARLSAEFSTRFPSPQDTLSYVADLSQEYSS